MIPPIDASTRRPVRAHCRREKPLDILCVEGSIVTAPRGTGLYDSYQGRARIDMARELAQRAGVVVAMGTCAAFGGIHAAPPNPADCLGLQYDRAHPAACYPRSGAPDADCR